MAITKIHAIKHTVSKAINYIGNPEKTENGNMIYSYGCGYGTAALEFEMTQGYAREGGENLAYHLIQSFKPGEVTAEQCHEIGKKFADEVLGGKYEYVLCTHTDTGVYHNHVIFNAVSFKDHKHYRSDKNSYYRIREISDSICNEYGLNVIEQNRTKPKKKYKRVYPKKTTNKEYIRQAINDAILYALDYEDFIREMKCRGCEYRQDEELWFKAEGSKRFTRTSSIGKAYTKENIQKRIKGIYRPKDITLIIDIEHNIKCQQSKGYEHWTKLHNLQAMAKTLIRIEELGISDYADLKKRISGQAAKIKSIQSQDRNAQKRIDDINSIIKNNEIRKKYLPIVKEYESKFMKGSFYKKHKKEIDIYNQACENTKKYQTNGKPINIQNILSEKKKLQEKINAHKIEIADIRDVYNDYAALKANVDMFLGNPTEQEKNIEKQKITTAQNQQPEQRDSLIKRLKDNQAEVDKYKQEHYYNKTNTKNIHKTRSDIY